MLDDFEFSPMALILGGVGFVVGLMTSSGFGASGIFKFIVALICGVVGFVVATVMANTG